MSKKKGEYSVMSEVNTEEEWLSLCDKEVILKIELIKQKRCFFKKKKRETPGPDGG